MDKTFEKCAEYFEYIHDYLDGYNDPNEEKGDRNFGLNQIKTFLIPAIKRILDTILDKSQVHSSHELIAKQQELSNKSVGMKLLMQLRHFILHERHITLKKQLN
jgi:hypothetical protein